MRDQIRPTPAAPTNVSPFTQSMEAEALGPVALPGDLSETFQ